MLIRHGSPIKSSEITPRDVYLSRRDVMGGGAALGLATALPAEAAKLTYAVGRYSISDKQTPKSVATSYNNFYEFGWDKEDPAKHAGALTTSPWSVTIDGMVERPGAYALEDLLKPANLEERIYRLRCVEAWSMVIPWVGFELRTALELAGVKSGAKYVAFETLLRPEEMRGQRRRLGSLNWPYREGLRLDEAMHPLTILANGMYGEEMPNQNGAPLRLVVPWKYGFKSIKSIVRITLTDRQPPTTWEALQPSEYGFFANVNPEVDHPRWSQASERVVDGSVFARRRETDMFNGYTDQVGRLYAGMDLRVNF